MVNFTDFKMDFPLPNYVACVCTGFPCVKIEAKTIVQRLV